MIENLFPIKIYTVQYPNDMSEMLIAVDPLIKKFNTIIKNNQGSMRGSGICSYNFKRDLHILTEFADLVKFIETHALVYWRDLGYDLIYTPRVTEMWFNMYNKDSFIDTHNHAPIPLTASFYLQKEDNVANIAFENPLSTMLKYQPFQINRDTYHTIFEEQINSKTGDLVIFPGWLNHKTISNSIDIPRLMIGANLCIEK
jgi:uncharacterized protein (TIGR02466 family)